MQTSETVTKLRDILGAKLVAYLGAVKNTLTVREWADGVSTPPEDIAKRLEAALEVAAILTRRDSKEVAQAWFQGMNPKLNDQSPAVFLCGDNLDGRKAVLVDIATRFADNGW